MAAQKGVRRPDYELELSDSEGYVGRICVAHDKVDEPLVWAMLQGILDSYIGSRFAEAEPDDMDD
jgi:hypothetical protein